MPPWDGNTQKLLSKGWKSAGQFKIKGERPFKKGDTIFVKVAVTKGTNKDCPAKILDIRVMADKTKILVAYYMLRKLIGYHIHKSDIERWTAVEADWEANGKYYALTNELQYINTSNVNGRNPDLQAEIDPDYVLFWRGTRYIGGKSRFLTWREVQAIGVDGWWEMDNDLKALAATSTQDDLQVINDITVENDNDKAPVEDNDLEADIQDKTDDDTAVEDNDWQACSQADGQEKSDGDAAVEDNDLQAATQADGQDKSDEVAAVEDSGLQPVVQDKANDEDSTVQASQPEALSDLGRSRNEPALQEDDAQRIGMRQTIVIGDSELMVSEPISGHNTLDKHPTRNDITVKERKKRASSGRKRRAKDDLRPPGVKKIKAARQF